ncbi:TPA: flagellar hook-length control protein FliK [Salmonella enterica subsp. enterica serovar Chester]
MAEIIPFFYKNLNPGRVLPFRNDGVTIDSGGNNMSEQWRYLLDKIQFEDKQSLSQQDGLTEFSRLKVQQKEAEDQKNDGMDVVATNAVIFPSSQPFDLPVIQTASALQDSFPFGWEGDNKDENTVINVNCTPGFAVEAVNITIPSDSKMVHDVKGDSTISSDKAGLRRAKLNSSVEQDEPSADQNVKKGGVHTTDCNSSKIRTQITNYPEIPGQRNSSHMVEIVSVNTISESNKDVAVNSHPNGADVMNTDTISKVGNALNLKPEVGLPEWNKALGDKIIYFVRNGVHQAQLKLYPEKLGELQISLRMNSDQVQLHFVSNDHQVRTVLESALPFLKTSLAESGIQLGNSSVGGEGAAWQEPGSEKKSSGEGFVENNKNIEDKEITLQVAHNNRGIDMFV